MAGEIDWSTISVCSNAEEFVVQYNNWTSCTHLLVQNNKFLAGIFLLISSDVLNVCYFITIHSAFKYKIKSCIKHCNADLSNAHWKYKIALAQ